MKKALSVIELSEQQQREILGVVACVLHLGNVGFTERDGVAEMHKPEAAEAVRQLLGVKFEELAHALTHRTIDARGDVVTTPLDRDLAVYARDALAKAVYERMFSWLVDRINASLRPVDAADAAVIGILDIYGFEIFKTNSFEQFCINFCNEKLQQLFIELTLKSEQEEYLREGIEWEPVAYFNNKIICDLIEEKHKGIIALMDEECLRPGDSSDLTLIAKMNKNLSYHKHYLAHEKADIRTQKTMARTVSVFCID